MSVKITVSEIEKRQTQWGEGIVKIGKDFLEKKDFKKTARLHVESF